MVADEIGLNHISKLCPFTRVEMASRIDDRRSAGIDLTLT